MANTDLAVRIATIFDEAGLKKADKAVNKLQKNTMKLGRALGLALGTTAMAIYGKNAVKAFAEDEAAAQRLTTAIDNLGLSLSATRAADFIASLEKTSGVVDDVLRPAFQALLTTTGSLTKSQELLNNAIQISRASGIELSVVAQDLANGYVGITKGLKKYNTGLTQAELKSKSFNEVLGVMLARSANAADAYLGTTAYKLDVLKVAADNAKESIGAGLVEAFAKAAGGTSAQDAAKAFDSIAKAINGITGAVGSAVGALTKLFRKYEEFSYNFDPLIGDSRATIDARRKKAASNRSSSPAGTALRVQQQRKAEAEAAKRAKELATLQTKQVAATKALTAEQKKQAALKKAQSMFDLEQIGIIAALKGNISEDERKRLELQLAIITGNEKEASALTYQLALAQGLTVKMAQELASLPMANNPFAAWKGYLDEIELQAKRIASIQFGSSARVGFETLTPTVQSLVSGASTGIAGSNRAGDVNITVNGSILSEQDLISAVQNGLQFNSLAGKPSDIGRIAGMFG